MSGDIGAGATTACIRLAEKVLSTQGKSLFVCVQRDGEGGSLGSAVFGTD